MSYRSYVAAAALLVTVSCSGGSEAHDQPPSDPTAAGTVERSGDHSVTDGGESPSPDGSSAVGDTVDVEALQSTLLDVVAPGAAFRCDRLGYTCSWSDLDPERFDDVLELASEIQGLVDAGPTPEAGLDAAVGRLASEPVVEIIVDREGMTGMLYRLEGTPELFATTSLAAPLGDPVTISLAGLEDELSVLAASNAVPAGFGSGPQPRSYHPTGGPLVPKRGIVLDPFATEEIECPPQTPLDGCLGDKKGRIEGSVVYGIMNAHPQIEIDYFAGSEVAPWNLTNLGSYDLVHIASHGTSGCANRNEGWTTGSDDPAEYVRTYREGLRSTPLDENECYSITSLGEFDKAEYDAWGQTVPPGIGLGGTNWGAVTDFFVGKLKPDAIVYLSNCTSADGQLYSSGSYGSFVGWHSYARTTVAYEAGIEFWRLMVVEGVEFEVAVAELDDRGLTSSVTLAPSGGVAGAFLAAKGKNQRARDVVTAKIDGGVLGGQVLRVSGIPNDGQPERFPAEGQEITFDVEGVKDGTVNDVKIVIRADDKKLQADIKVERDGTELDDDHDDWSTWRVTLPPNAVELPDTNAADYAPDAEPIELEVRAYLQEAEYTADKGGVTLGTRLASNGPLPIFTQLAATMPAGGEIRGNDLRIEFDTAGGEVTGYMRVEMIGSGLIIGYWQYELDGTYDPESGNMTGQVIDESTGGAGGIRASDSGSGTWQASVDMTGKRVTGTLDADGQNQSYIGTISPVSTG